MIFAEFITCSSKIQINITQWANDNQNYAINKNTHF